MQIAHAHDARVNDVLLASIAGGLRGLLHHRGEHVDDLVMPIYVFGRHWGGPEGETFGRAARRFEEIGVDALLVNCIPPDHVDGMVSYLRDFTDMPLGVYPNLGYLTAEGWYFDPGISGEVYGELALRWREGGAQVIGGCSGV